VTQPDVKSRLERAIKTLLDKDGPLLECDVNERSITHKLAEYLHDEFPEWDVACEYNRDEHDAKYLDLPVDKDISSQDTEGRTVFPDIIIHKRKTNCNLLVLEAKKTGGSPLKDYNKLKAFKNQLRYEYAVFIRFNTGTRWKELPQLEPEWR
jgi:hypothetical protein